MLESRLWSPDRLAGSPAPHSIDTQLPHEISSNLEIPEIYLTDLKDQAKNPPGKDGVMGACYEATLELLQEYKDFKNFLAGIIAQRPMIPTHFTNLYFRSIQYMELFERTNPEYPHSFKNVAHWKKELLSLKEEFEELWQKNLLEKDTTTTIYQRYAGSLAAVSALFPGQEVSLADFGCGGNYGLRGIDLGIPFATIEDQTPDQFVTEMLMNPARLRRGLAVDRQDPDDIHARLWRLGCSFYPQELGQMSKQVEFEQRVKAAQNVDFLQGDLLHLQVNHADGTLPRGRFDAVIMNTMLYQMTPEEQATVLASARECLQPEGVLVMQDFGTVDKNDSRKMDHDVSWFGKPNMYRTFIAQKDPDEPIREVFRWTNGRCRGVTPGDALDWLRDQMRKRK